MKIGILLIQLGSPKTPAIKDVKIYLKEFLSDSRVIENQNFIWKIILNLIILPNRSSKSAARYQKIWINETFPLFKYTQDFSEKLEKIISKDIILKHSYVLSFPRVEDVLLDLYKQGCREIKVIPLFPQYSQATTLSCKDAIERALKKINNKIEINFVKSFHKNSAYINSLVRQINDFLVDKNIDKLLFSFHGYPIRRIQNQDPYLNECLVTANLVAERLKNLSIDKVKITFQSNFNREQWLRPSTEETLIDLAKNGIKKVAIICPGFLVDNLETEVEVDLELKKIFMGKGGEKFYRIPCLNGNDDWVEEFLEKIVKDEGKFNLNLQENKLPIEEQGCCDAKVQCETCPYNGLDIYPNGKISHKNKKVLKAIFITLLLDLIGFSMIFPLFPELLEFYKKTEGLQIDSFFHVIYNTILQYTGNVNSHATIALFGGILTFLYSFLQFVMAPIFGIISDKIGRRPILIFSLSGIAFSYFLWIFSGSFILLVISRAIAGIMAGNITTATASVADVTTKKNRSRGMAYVGIAFGLGFTIGPVIGGLASIINLTEIFPNLAAYGINPFSIPALLAFLLALYNLFYVIKNFPETLPQHLRGKTQITRTANPIKLFCVANYVGVKRIIWGNFFFLVAFAAAETVLTFLTYERFGFSNVANGLIFLYIGLVLALFQGGYVRRKAHEVGELKMTKRGLVLVIPAFCLIALSGQFQSIILLYFAVGIMAIAAAMIIPCFTALVSMYTPEREQGRILGIFRSLGALARTLGPLLAGILYWKYGFFAPYYVSAIIIILPIMIIYGLSNFKKDD